MYDTEFFKTVRDPRGYIEDISGPLDWRKKLREQIYADRGMRSDLTKRPLIQAFDLHEGIYSRKWSGKNTALQNCLFSGPNVFILRPDEHMPFPPSPEICYWLACARYTCDVVDRWIESLPSKVRMEKPYAGSYGIEVVARIPERWKVCPDWYKWFSQVKSRIDFEV